MAVYCHHQVAFSASRLIVLCCCVVAASNRDTRLDSSDLKLPAYCGLSVLRQRLLRRLHSLIFLDRCNLVVQNSNLDVDLQLPLPQHFSILLICKVCNNTNTSHRLPETSSWLLALRSSRLRRPAIMHSLSSETGKSHDQSTRNCIRATAEKETGETTADATGYCAGFGAVTGCQVTGVPCLENETS